MVEHLDGVFGAIADPTRRAILQQLGRSPARVTDIARKFPVSLNAISKHLIVLERAGLIRRDIQGTRSRLQPGGKPLTEAAAWIEGMRQFWEIRLDALERHIAGKRRKKQ